MSAPRASGAFYGTCPLRDLPTTASASATPARTNRPLALVLSPEKCEGCRVQCAYGQVADSNRIGGPSRGGRGNLVQDLCGKKRNHHVLYRRFVNAAHVKPQENHRVYKNGTVNRKENAATSRGRSPNVDHGFRAAECSKYGANRYENSHVYRKRDSSENGGPRGLGINSSRHQWRPWPCTVSEARSYLRYTSDITVLNSRAP